jgi:hypothetical protein
MLVEIVTWVKWHLSLYTFKNQYYISGATDLGIHVEMIKFIHHIKQEVKVWN